MLYVMLIVFDKKHIIYILIASLIMFWLLNNKLIPV